MWQWVKWLHHEMDLKKSRDHISAHETDILGVAIFRLGYRKASLWNSLIPASSFSYRSTARPVHSEAHALAQTSSCSLRKVE
jgi:hypothetical protein